jgi:hypothetical protein
VAHMTSALQDKSAVKVSIALGRLYVRADLPQLWPCSGGENEMTQQGHRGHRGHRAVGM